MTESISSNDFVFRKTRNLIRPILIIVLHWRQYSPTVIFTVWTLSILRTYKWDLFISKMQIAMVTRIRVTNSQGLYTVNAVIGLYRNELIKTRTGHRINRATLVGTHVHFSTWGSNVFIFGLRCKILWWFQWIKT